MPDNQLHVLIDFEIRLEALDALKAIGVHVTTVEPNDEEARPLPAELIAPVHAELCTFPPTNLQDMPLLRFIQICSSGYSQLFGLGLPERGIRASNASGVFDTAIAEWIIAMTINLARDLRGLIRNQEARVFDRDARFQRDVGGRRMGIWGYGGIGRQTARLAKALGMEVWAHAPTGIRPRPNHFLVDDRVGDPQATLPDRVFTAAGRKEFLAGLDFLVLTMPLTAQTDGIVGEAELRALPPKCFLLNPARGPLVQEQPLLRALREGWIAGAAIDAHYSYPLPADHPLWRFPNVILTPHISGSTKMAYFAERVWAIFLENVRRLRDGRPLLNELPADQLASKKETP
jgi:phosphoglycerate dehydrogenase-like enzyme